MPSFVQFRGRRIYQPSVLVDVNNNLISPDALGGKSLCVIGDFPQMKPNVTHTFSSSTGLEVSDVFPHFRDIRDVDKIWKSSIAGSGAVSEKMTLVNVNQSVAAKLDANSVDLDAGDNLAKFPDNAYAQLEFESTYYGTYGNRIQLKLDDDQSNAAELDVDSEDAFRLTIKEPGFADVEINVGYPDQLLFKTAATHCLVIYEDSVDNKVKCHLATQADPDTAVGDIIILEDVATNKALMGLLEVIAASNTVAFSPESFNFDTHPKFLDLGVYDGAGILANDAAARVHAHTKALVDAVVADDTLPITVKSKTNGHAPLASFAVAALAGGTQEASVNNSKITELLPSLENKDFTSMCVQSSNAGVHDQVKLHLEAAEIAGRERNAWLPASENQSISQINASYVKRLSSPLVSYFGQGISYEDYQGNVRTEADPFWGALVMMCMQGALPAAEALTRKRPGILNTTENWDRERDVNAAIKAGVVVVGLGSNNQLRVERSITSYRDDNLSYNCEVSARESINTCVRELRSFLEGQLGSRITSATKDNLKSLAERRLKTIEDAGIIFGAKNIEVRVANDTAFIDFDVALIEPLNFIRITANLVRNSDF